MKLRTISKELTAAQVNALDGTPVNVIPAPAAGYSIKVTSFLVAKTSGTAAGSCATQPIGLVYTGDTELIAALDAVGAATNSNLVLATGTAAASYLNANGDVFSEAFTGTVSSGTGVDISAPGATVGSFDGTLQVTVSYQLLKIGRL